MKTRIVSTSLLAVLACVSAADAHFLFVRILPAGEAG